MHLSSPLHSASRHCVARPSATAFPALQRQQRVCGAAPCSTSDVGRQAKLQEAMVVNAALSLPMEMSAAHPEPAPAAETERIVELHGEAVQAFLGDASGLVVIDFYADYCGPCRMMAPHYEKMALVFPKIKFGKLNCSSEDNQVVAKQMRVRSMPTFSLFQNGRLIESVSGAAPLKLHQMLMHYNR